MRREASPQGRDILVVHNRFLNGSEIRKMRELARRVPGTRLVHAETLNDTQGNWARKTDDLSLYGAVILKGSSDMDRSRPTQVLEDHDKRMEPLVHQIFDSGKPAYATCLSHQSVNEFLGGEVRRNPRRHETGTAEVILTEAGIEHPIFEGVVQDPSRSKDRIRLIVVHKDAVTKKAPNAKQLGYTDRDPNAILQIGNIITVQGHAELTDPKQVEEILNDTNKLLEEADQLGTYEQTSPFTDPDHTELLLVNFIRDVPTREMLGLVS
ncbi:MAG TPA: hypothetical protein VLF93_02235 [Candidatus Saccharimonadales bacterium]|nr:hypothetical protein [Candidatus Saccharimonadales bacterium]